MVVNADKDSIVQTNHYYPYGGIIGNLSSNQEVLLGSNCIKTVQKALSAAELDDGSNPWTTIGIGLLSPIAGVGYSKIPNDIYRRIKDNNKGTTIIKVKQ